MKHARVEVPDCLDRQMVDVLFSIDPSNPAIAKKLIGIYVNDGSKRVHGIADAVAKGDATAVAEGAHAFKSSSWTVGASEVGRICEAMERAGELPSAEQVAELQAAFERACVALRKLTA